MKKVLLFSIMAAWLSHGLHAQISCNATSIDVDLSASIDTTVSFQSTRNGNCCSGTNCIRFNLKINPACSYVNFSVANPAPPGNSAYYQIDCGTPTSLGTPICIVGKTDVVISFCKPGNDNPIYTITAAGALKGSDDITVREGCTGGMSVTGLQPATINWTSIYPSTEGTYNSWLNCTSACTSVNVIPQTGAPPYVDFKVSGYRICGPLVTDTIRVYTNPQIDVSISPDNPYVCAGGTSSVTLTATALKGDAPYSFLWSNGQSGPSITVSSGATYTVSVTDIRNCIPAVQSTVVKTTALPPTPTISSNTPVCDGGSLQLSIPPVAGASYYWTGPNGFTSDQQNPVINNVSLANAGSYSVVVKVGQCSSAPATTTVVVNPLPPAPVVASNSPVCETGNLNLTAGTIAAASYSWSGPGFNSSSQNPVIGSVGLMNAGNYSVAATVSGCTGPASSVTVVINALPPAPVVSSITPVCEGSSISLKADPVSNAIFNWTGPNGFASALQNPVITDASLSNSGTYSVTATQNGCTGPASTLTVAVNPVPLPPALSSNGAICEGSDIHLWASPVNGAVYSWNGPNGFTSSLQNPVVAFAPVSASGAYSAIVTMNGCSSVASNVNVIVNPIPATPVISGNTRICEGSILSLSAPFVSMTSYQWTGPNSFTSSGSSVSIPNAGSIHSGVYSLIAMSNGCSSLPAAVNVLINKLPVVPQINSNSPICSGNSLSLNAGDLTGAVYSWTGPNNFSSTDQNLLIPNVSSKNAGTYSLSVTVNGCSSSSSSSSLIVVNPTPAVPVINNSGPVCEGSNLLLSANNVAGGSFTWTGPNGFSSTLQNNSLSSVSKSYAGSYAAVVTVNGCSSLPSLTVVNIDQPAIAYAGSDQIICAGANTLGLKGSVSGGKGTGIWTTSGTGNLSNAGSLVTNFYPSAKDKDLGTVTVYLTSTNNGACPVSVSQASIQFVPMPHADAGADQTICADSKGAVLNASLGNASSGIWTSSGTGSFQPSASVPNATYNPGTKDRTDGLVKLTWTSAGNGPCPAASDATTITIKKLPSISVGGGQYVLENNSVILKPVVSGSGLTYSWTPAVFLNNDTILNPVCTPKANVSYRFFAKDDFGCSASADVVVKLIKKPQIPNVFTPNGDGINDTWEIKNLSDYADCTIDIYNRYGQLVHHCTGYGKEWDGNYNGKPLPAATYYYIIDLKTGAKPLSGFVDIIR